MEDALNRKTRLPYGEQIKRRDGRNGCKYLSILEADGIKDWQLKQKTKAEFYWYMESNLKLKLYLESTIHIFYKKDFLIQYWNFLSFSWFQYQNFLKTFFAKIFELWCIALNDNSSCMYNWKNDNSSKQHKKIVEKRLPQEIYTT